MLAGLIPREIHAYVNAGFTLVECLREIDQREAQAEEGRLLMAMVIALTLFVLRGDGYLPFINGISWSGRELL